LEPEFGGRKVNTITRELVRRYFARLVAEGRAPGTVRKVHAVMSAIMAEAVELGYVRGNPCAGVKGLPRAGNREMLFLTADEVRTLAEAIDPHYRVYVYAAAFTGLRSSELTGLRWRNVDLLHGKLTVAEALKEEGGNLIFGPPKTHERRTLSLPRFLVEMLAAHAASRPQSAGPGDLVFTGPQGGPLRHHLFYRRHFRPTVAGRPARNGKPAVPGILPERLHALRFHDLRHTCASLLIAEGAHPKLIQTRLGHSSITITLDTYSHVFPSLEESLAAKLDSAFEAAQPPASNVVPLAAGAVGR
jgi:integrase